jgi:hypothetical protein
MATLKTPNDGANAERKAIKAYLQRRLKKNPNARISCVIAWIADRDERYNKKAGGLGKR